MADIADRHGIEVVLCSILPVTNTPAAGHIEAERKPELLREVNARLRTLAAERGHAYADYASVLTGPDGRLRTDLTTDGVHPLAAGYALMAPVAEAAIVESLGKEDET
jgi:lysophospholipase L1-like esterase